MRLQFCFFTATAYDHHLCTLAAHDLAWSVVISSNPNDKLSLKFVVAQLHGLYMAVLTSSPGCATHWKYLSWQAYRLLFRRNWADPKTSELNRKICRGENMRVDSAEKSKMQDWKDDRSAQREGCSHTYFASSLLRKADRQEKCKMCHWASSGSQSSSSLIDWQENYEWVLH